MIDDAEVSALIKAERTRLAVMFILFAISRDIEAKATGDQRFGRRQTASSRSKRRWFRSATTC